MAFNEENLLKGPRAWVNRIPATSEKSPSIPRTRAILRMTLSQLFGLTWLVPIIALLVLNYTDHIIGASVGCALKKDCNHDSFAENAIQQAAKMDKKDHNILGTLQFVAKALEIWFMIIATCLVYDLTMLLAIKETEYLWDTS